MNNMNINAV